MNSDSRPAALLWLLLMLGMGVAALLLFRGLPLTPQLDFSRLAETDTTVEIAAGRRVEQSFLPLSNGLTALVVNVARAAPPGNTLTLTLLDGAGATVARQRFDAVPQGDLALDFPTQPDSANQGYRLRIESTGGAAQLAALSTDRTAGHLRLNDDVQRGDLALAWYSQATAQHLLGHAATVAQRFVWPLLLSALLWWLPGWLIVAWLRRGEPAQDPWSLAMLATSSGLLSAALLVLLPLWTTQVGLRLGPWAFWLIVGVSLIGLLLAQVRRWPLRPTIRPDGLSLLYLFVVLMLVISRLAPLDGLAGAMWGDGVHHSLIVDLVMRDGGVPSDYAPLVPLTSFSYHVGFHLLCAWLGWAVPPGGAPLDPTTATLLGAQWLNIWDVLAVGLLAEALCQQTGRASWGRRANLLAVLVAGLLLSMPGFYANWGRFTQLAGQLFFPAAVAWLLWLRADRPRRWLPLVLILAALAIAHYRVVMMWAVALPPLLFLLRRGPWRGQRLRLIGQGLVAALAVAILVAPWFVSVALGQLDEQMATMLNNSAAPNAVLKAYNSPPLPWQFYPRWLLALAASSALWLIVKRQRAGGLMVALVALWYLLSNPYTLLRLPGTGIVNNFMIDIALYIPLAVLIGVAGAGLWQQSRTALPSGPPALAGALLIGALALGGLGRQTVQIAPQIYGMQTRPDVEAARWIATNLPRDAMIHINGFPAFGGGVVVGSDGGWWLWQSAERATTVPPIVYDKERGPTPTYTAEVNARHAALREAAQQSPQALADALQGDGIDYLYIGAMQGRVGLPGDEVALDGQALLDSGAFALRYDNDFAQLFEVVR